MKKVDSGSVVEVSVYGDGKFFEFVYNERFVTVEVEYHLPYTPFITSVTAPSVKTGAAYQGFERFRRFPKNDRRFVISKDFARRLIALHVVREAGFDEDSCHNPLKNLTFLAEVELRRTLRE